MVVKSDEDVDGYGDGDRGDSARRAVLHPTHLQPHHPYYFILTVHNPLNTQHHNTYHAHDNSSDNHLDNNAHDNALHYAHDNAQRTVASATASTSL